MINSYGKKSMVDVRTKGKISYRGYGSNIIPVSTDNPISSSYTLIKTTNPRKYKIPYVDRNGKIHDFMEKVSKPKRRLEYRGSYEIPINSNIPVDATAVVRPDTTEIEYPNFIFGIDNNNYGLFTTGISSYINGNLIDYNNNGRSISQEEAIDRIKGYVKSPSERRVEAIEKAFPNREKRKEGGTNKRIFLGDVPGITNVDTRSDSTRQGYHEGTIPYGAGSGLNVLGPVGLVMKGIDELDRQTNMSREDSPIYHPGLITGEAPGVGGITKARNALEALEMIKAMKAAKSAKQLKTVERINKVKPTASYEINSTAKNYASRPIINEVRQPTTPKPRPVRTEEERQAIIQKGLETRRANAAKLSEEELAQKKANKIAKIKATMEQHSVKNHSWQHTKRNNEYSRQELLDVGLNNEDFSRHIITQRGGKTWVSDMKYGGSINIAPSKRGTFTAAASKHGMGVQEFASKVLRNKEDYSPSLVKKANFARNASKWNH